MPDWLRFILAAFTAYRLAQLVAIDDGPRDVFLRFRTWAGAYEYGADGRPASDLGRWAACPFCVGVWAGALCAVFVWLGWDIVLLPLGIAGAQAWLQGRRDDQAG